MLPRNLMLALDFQMLACQALKLGMTYMAEAYLEGVKLLRMPDAVKDVVMHESAQIRVEEGLALFSGIALFYKENGRERGREYAKIMDDIFKEKHTEHATIDTRDEALALDAFLRDVGPMSRGGNA